MGSEKMNLSVLLLLALPSLCSASPLNIRNNTEPIHELNGTRSTSMEEEPLLVTVAKFRQKRQVQSPPVAQSGDGHNLKWVTWNSSLPDYAVSIYNRYVGRTHYVCKYKCHAGFYDPGNTYPKCYYANQNKEHDGFPFEILVNKDNFEILEWKDGSYGSVPHGSVRTCPGEGMYVGKNKYGLGKVDTKVKVFYLPWKGSQYWYNYYQVLTVNENIFSQEIYNIRYITDESEILKFPPELMRESTIKNEECHPVLKTDTLTKTYQVTQNWDFVFSIKTSIKTSITSALPFLTSGGIGIGLETTFQYSSGSTVIDTTTDSVTLEVTAPPNKSCTLNMMRHKSKVTIPFSACLKRTYGNGETHMTILTGMYSSILTEKVQVTLKRCEPLGNASTCP